MKPIDIFNAMDGISEKYITEAEQAVKNKKKSRRLNAESAGNAAAVNGGNSNTVIQKKTGNPRAQKRQNRKEDTGMRISQPIWQRLTTGIAAAAACAVFVGGGLFIMQQAKQIEPEHAGSSAAQQTTAEMSDAEVDTIETGDTNILGGHGAIHAAGSPWLLYDDSSVYFEYTTARGDRYTDAPIAAAAQMNAGGMQLVCDGKSVYTAEGFSLYRLGQDGNPEAEPFFTVSDETIQDITNTFRAKDDAVTDIRALSFTIDRLNNESYYIHVQFCENAATQQAEHFENRAWIYNAETGECGATDIAGFAAAAVQFSTDGTAFYFQPTTNLECFIRMTLDPLSYEQIDLPADKYLMSGCGSLNWFVNSGAAYYVTPGEGYDFENVRYCKYDMATEECNVYEESPDFTEFLTCDGTLFAVSKAGTQIYSATPELKNITLLFDYEKDTPEQLRKCVSAAIAEYDLLQPIAKLDAVDETYLAAHLGDGTYLLLDRRNGKVRFYRQPDDSDDRQDSAALAETTAETAAETTAKPVTETAAETTVQSDEGNVLGGYGTLYPVGWSNHGETALLRDNNYYYYYDTSCWFRCPITGGQRTRISERINGAQSPREEFISDGERIYTLHLDIVSEGSADNAFDPSAVQEYLRKLNEQTVPKGWFYDCKKIWHIRDRYFMVMWAAHIAGTNPDEDLSAIAHEIWTDDTGSILSDKQVSRDNAYYYCSNDKREIYRISGGENDLIDCPGYEEFDKPDPTAYGEILDAYCVMEDEYYLTADYQLYTREHGQPVLMSGGPVYTLSLMIAPDRNVYYIQPEGTGDALYLWNGSGNKTLIFQPENGESLFLCGFEDNGTGGYNIIVSQWNFDTNTYTFLFVDAATHAVVRQITE